MSSLPLVLSPGLSGTCLHEVPNRYKSNIIATLAGWYASPLQGDPSILFHWYPFIYLVTEKQCGLMLLVLEGNNTALG